MWSFEHILEIKATSAAKQWLTLLSTVGKRHVKTFWFGPIWSLNTMVQWITITISLHILSDYTIYRHLYSNIKIKRPKICGVCAPNVMGVWYGAMAVHSEETWLSYSPPGVPSTLWTHIMGQSGAKFEEPYGTAIHPQPSNNQPQSTHRDGYKLTRPTWGQRSNQIEKCLGCFIGLLGSVHHLNVSLKLCTLKAAIKKKHFGTCNVHHWRSVT